MRRAEPVPDSLLYSRQPVADQQRAYAALSVAETGLRKDPYNPRDVAAKAAALCQSGRSREAVDYLMDLKAQYADFFPHQLALADAFAAARMFQDAAAAYEAVLAEKDYGPAQQQAARERLQAMNRDQRLLAGEHAVRTNNRPAAQQALASLQAQAGHPDVLALQAAVLTKEGRFDEARALLNRVAASGWSSRTMAEARLALADAERNGGAWGPAAADYGAVQNDASLTARERQGAAKANREMLARVAPTITHNTWASSQNEGTLWTSGIELSSGALGDGRNLVFLRGIWDEIGLGHQKLVGQDDADRFQAEAAWRRLTKRGFYGEVTAGGSSEGPTYGAAVGRYDQPGPGWELRFRANERAADSLLLLALGGTQTGATFHYFRRVGERWYVDAKLGWRRVEIDDATLGEGIDLDFRLVYTLVEERDGRIGLTAGYFAEVQHFDHHRLPDLLLATALHYARREDDSADALLDDRINRHGLVVTATRQFGAHWNGFVYGGVAYEFEAGRAEALAGAGLTAWLSRNTTLIFGIDYASSGNAGNKGDDVVTGSVKLRVSF